MASRQSKINIFLIHPRRNPVVDCGLNSKMPSFPKIVKHIMVMLVFSFQRVFTFKFSEQILKQLQSPPPPLQTQHVNFTLKRRGNGPFHVVSTWNTRDVL